MASYVGELVCRWVPEANYNHQGPMYKGYAGEFSDVTGQPDANIVPEPNAYVCAFVVDEKTAEQLQADPDFVVLWIEAVRTDEIAGLGDVVRAPESRLHNEAALDAAAADVAGAWHDLWKDDMDMLAGGEAERAPGIEPDAVEKKPPDVVPPANERAALTTRLVALGLRGTDLASIITAQNARGVAAERLKELCKNFPKAKV